MQDEPNSELYIVDLDGYGNILSQHITNVLSVYSQEIRPLDVNGRPIDLYVKDIYQDLIFSIIISFTSNYHVTLFEIQNKCEIPVIMERFGFPVAQHLDNPRLKETYEILLEKIIEFGFYFYDKLLKATNIPETKIHDNYNFSVYDSNYFTVVVRKSVSYIEDISLF